MKNAIFTILVTLICIMICFNAVRVILSGDTSNTISLNVLLEVGQSFTSDVDSIFEDFSLLVNQLLVIENDFVNIWTGNNLGGSSLPVLDKILSVVTWVGRLFVDGFGVLYYAGTAFIRMLGALWHVFRDLLVAIDRIIGLSLFGDPVTPNVPDGWGNGFSGGGFGGRR